MIRVLRKSTVLIILLILFGSGAVVCDELPSDGDMLPIVRFDGSESAEQAEYLGVKPDQAFPIADIDARIIIIETFSMYCPHCQREAPSVNELYHAIESDPLLSENVRLIGIGVGNSDFEVESFRKKYNIPFPLFSDKENKNHKLLGRPMTPYFFCVEKKPGGLEVFHTKLGGIIDREQFLERITSRLKQEVTQ